MIRRLSIDRFKSIKTLSLPCRKVNVFIGAPDTGKTNILEALYLLSRFGWGLPMDGSLRIRQDLGFEVLFYRQFLSTPLQIALQIDPRSTLGDVAQIPIMATLSGTDRALEIQNPFVGGIRLAWGSSVHLAQFDWIRYYNYASSESWQYSAGFHLGTKVVSVPYGHNLIYIARHDERVFNFLKEMIVNLNWRLKFDLTQKTFRLSEVRDDEITEYNLDLLSDSLKRLFFYGAVLLSSENATLIFDEPDVFAFPPYPKTLGEMIAADESNQFFLTTHNSYFLSALAEKTPADNLSLFVCYRDAEGSTQAKPLSIDEVSRVIELGASVFFNLDEFVSS